MIQASFKRDEKSKAIIMQVKGHAGQDDKGHDIVCSAASILTYTVAQYLTYVHKQNGLLKEPHIDIKDGDATIVAKPIEKYEGEVLNAFFVAEVGYSLLAHNYPQYVELNMFSEAE